MDLDSRFNMRILVAFILAFVFIQGGYSQDSEILTKSELKRLQKEQQKAEKEAELAKAAEITEFIIANQQFVLEADYLSNKSGERISVIPSINFVMVDSLTGTLQLGSAMDAGYNGVGGATIQGKISSYEYIKIGKKKDSYSIRMIIMSSIGNYDITLMVSSHGRADANIRGNWGTTLSYHGKLIPLSESRVFKGMPLY
ncbi:DUF4251 domain-containing protein [Bacteroidota bacterium]